jgi:hypothetical protein
MWRIDAECKIRRRVARHRGGSRMQDMLCVSIGIVDVNR